MPTTDEPARPPRRPLGRGPGGRTVPERAGGPDTGTEPPAPALPADGAASAHPAAAPEAPDAPEPAEVPESAEALEVPETAEALEAPESAEVPETVETSGTVEAPEAPETVETSEAPETVEAPEVPEAPGSGAPEPEASGAEGEAAEDGRFTVRLANFEGPFDLLLQLISKHKLDVTEVALSKVTDEFMAHIRAMGPDWDLDQTTEFLVVAATLLDLKAARLLPTAEVEDEADLALLEARDLLFARLLQYRAYKRIAEIFSERLESEGRRFPRTVGLEPHHAELLPEVAISIGAEGFARLAVKAMQPRPKPQVYVDHIHAPLVSVREQAGIVVARLREAGEATFRALTEDAPDTLTVVARFLALLELYREKAVALDQDEALGELLVRWAGGEGDEPVVTDEFDTEAQGAQEDVKA
ncbi:MULTISPECIES: segregation/condensation protein A [unclassified Streptomyces]|uniref:segregation/condensation protein A n=1 Tax=unclassified Streptomyces TaxID=2593676 RepID=UPI0035DF4965